MYRLPLILSLLLICSTALAGEPAVYDRVNLSERATAEVQNDLMVAVLFAQHEGRDTTRLADQVNRDISSAIAATKKIPGIEVRTQSYRTQPIYQKNKIKGWRVSQSIRLQSTDSKTLGRLLGDLQDRLMLQSVGYEVSPQQRRQYIDDVIRTALKRFNDRARLVSESLGKQHWRLVRLSVNDGGPAPVPMLRTEVLANRVLAKSAAPVAIEAGTTRLNVSVNGEIELSD